MKSAFCLSQYPPFCRKAWFMTIECSQSVHSIVLRMAQVSSNVFYKCYKYKKGGLFCQEVCGERFSDPAIDGVRSAVNGSGQLCRQRLTVRGKNQIFFAAITCPESFPNRTPSVLAGRHVIIFLKEPDIAPDVGVADLLADRLDCICSVGQQREGTFRAVAV